MNASSENTNEMRIATTALTPRAAVQALICPPVWGSAQSVRMFCSGRLLSAWTI